MAKWKVLQGSDRVEKKIRGLQSDKVAANKLVTIVQELEECDDPAKLGRRKKGRHRFYYGLHLTKSVSLVYDIDYENSAIYLIDIGDHKALYGRDG